MMLKPNRALALQLAKRQLPELVCDAVNLEGIHYTLPEVMTLLDGVTIGGHKLSDETITLNQATAWKHLFAAIDGHSFVLSKDFACKLHAIAGKEEALKWGSFRDGNVTIAGTNYMPPLANTLPQHFETMLSLSQKIEDIYDRAIFSFLSMARTQFFYDVNKRMGRFMMNGILLDAGYPVINVPARRQLEFNTEMLAFYDSNAPAAMNAFFRSCLDQRALDCFSSLQLNQQENTHVETQ